MRQCDDCFREALELGHFVKHYSGEEGIDELWGEPFKAFTLPIATVYESRYMKIARAMRDIDGLAGKMESCFMSLPGFRAIGPLLQELSAAAKLESETMRSDRVIFRVWPRFVAAGEDVAGFRPALPEDAPLEQRRLAEEALRLGLTNWVVPADELAAKTREIALRLASGPTVAYRYMKENLNRAMAGEVDECLDLEATHHVHCGQTQDHREATKAFVDKREPVFNGR